MCLPGVSEVEWAETWHVVGSGHLSMVGGGR